jgi:hypothetical protein
MVCTPKKWDELGIKDLDIQNKALMLMWWWRAQTTPESLLTNVFNKLHLSAVHTNDPPFWKKQGSFFLVQLLALRHLFDACTTYQIRDGKSISF